MLQMILKIAIRKYLKPRKKVYVEQLLYSKEVYPIYIKVQKEFNYLVKNKLIKRPQLLEFKRLINSYINTKYYSDYKFKNDIHEIYKKLKDTTFSKKQMLSLKAYVDQFMKA